MAPSSYRGYPSSFEPFFSFSFVLSTFSVLKRHKGPKRHKCVSDTNSLTIACEGGRNNNKLRCSVLVGENTNKGFPQPLPLRFPRSFYVHAVSALYTTLIFTQTSRAALQIGIHPVAACLAGHSCVDYISSCCKLSTQMTIEGVAAVDIDCTSFPQRALQDTAAWTT